MTTLLRDEITLRDWFAGQSMFGVLAARTLLAWEHGRKPMPNQTIAEECYELADAMMAERRKQA